MILDCIGGNIKKARELKGISIAELAKSLGMTEEKYSRIEKGIDDISLPLISSIANRLNISVNELTEIKTIRIDEPNEKLKKAKEILDLFYANKRAYLKLTSK